MVRQFIYKQIDNSQLVVFRILFGALLLWQVLDYTLSGWVKNNFIKPSFTFSHIGMEWLQPLPGNGMYYYFVLMGVSALLILIGLQYRLSIIVFTILWSGIYFMQKTTYNNHHYLVILICFLMCLLPANAYASIDSRINPKIKRLMMPSWCSWTMVLQIAIVYFYASVAKLYSGWLDGSFTKGMLARHAPDFLKDFYAQEWFYIFIAYAGLAFDFLVIPLLLWKKTRNLALVASVLFHIFNKAHLGIGIFPFLALSLIVFFYPPETIRKLFLWRKHEVIVNENTTEGKKIVQWILIPYFVLQILLPIRHYAIKGDVLWTEEGHRLSWRMMLRSRKGTTKFKVVNNQTKEVKFYKLKKILTKKQIKGMQSKPDMIWQTAQKIREKYARIGKDVSVYADSKVSINHGEARRLINPNVDLGRVKWNYFWHNDWILLYDKNGNLIH
ncbi:vitamin K-dependent gamma-carboxylase-like protein [Flavobacterium endophyticum]|uniref:Vitamin K-dependent gamma-carboxylase-like protein n=1 Tax=Flavobacterium endophyticum TaxID=1540163 RepID=A0A495MH89_9FLAO|nr:HTTM domain-containing protein [Flavobacterium endophyticum]RKS25334.1 vitamin K-dependent gamma-carboxylase-like protein [Flavobacterium endophyticum]